MHVIPPPQDYIAEREAAIADDAIGDMRAAYDNIKLLYDVKFVNSEDTLRKHLLEFNWYNDKPTETHILRMAELICNGADHNDHQYQAVYHQLTGNEWDASPLPFFNAHIIDAIKSALRPLSIQKNGQWICLKMPLPPRPANAPVPVL